MEAERTREALAEMAGMGPEARLNPIRITRSLLGGGRDPLAPWCRSSLRPNSPEIGDPRAVDPLIEALGDDYSDVRAAAAEALDKLG
ncbi:MAG TPA: HEAT repeat domain-containing protein [Methanothrix sp.]|nr:HEAT repeat domain-containing protein [Methanothrix sp.]